MMSVHRAQFNGGAGQADQAAALVETDLASLAWGQSNVLGDSGALGRGAE